MCETGQPVAKNVARTLRHAWP